MNHDKLMSLARERVKDERVRALIYRYLKAGVMIGDDYQEAVEGTPQGGPLSPLLANLLLDLLDRELERRGHCFVRYGDDCNIYVQSAKAGRRVLASVTRYLLGKLRLKVNERKSAVDRPWRRRFLGFTFTGREPGSRMEHGEVSPWPMALEPQPSACICLTESGFLPDGSAIAV